MSGVDKLHALAELVRQMREAQKRYFRDRTNTALQESKRLERLVDQWLIQSGAAGVPAERVQASLFEQEV